MNPFLIRAVLFDFDGVLFDSEPVRFRAGAQALTELGITLTWEDFTRCWLGRTDEAGLRDIMGERFEADGRQVIARRNALYEERLDEVQAFTDAGRFLRRVPHGIRLAIATGSRRLEVEGILWRAVMTQSFQTIVTAEDYGRPKPAPDPFQAAARLLKLSPASCLVIEDSPSGVAAAQAAGMPVVAVERGREIPGLEKATWKVATLDDLSLTPRGEVVVTASATKGDTLT
jgi:beta-phosphoglucomutase-like phosphatase (HAD superfamily)